jgi:hypothetical protein
MATTVSALTAVEPSLDGKTAKLVFPRKTGKPLEVVLPLEQLALAVEDIKRAAEIYIQRKAAVAGGIKQVAFSVLRTITPHPDMMRSLIYLQIDEGTPLEIIYAMKASDALKFGLKMMEAGELWLRERDIPEKPQ